MARQNINIGQFANDRTGDPLRTAFSKTNQNFTELYDIVGEIPTSTSDLENDSGFVTSQEVPTDISELSDDTGLLESGTTEILPFLELTNNPLMILDVEFGESVQFTKVDGDTDANTSIDFIDTGISLTRGNQGGLYNIESEVSYQSNSPIGTLWNSDGWDGLSNYRQRDYVDFQESLDGAVGQNIIGAELLMWDIINDKYYTFDFSAWTQGANGGGFSYTRRELIDPNYFKKSDNGDEVDIFVADSPEGSGIAITRGVIRGIYNPYREPNGWDSDISPSGTLWNADGWSNLRNVESRNYTNFYDAVDQNLGNNVPDVELVMYIPDVDKYYAIKFLSWTQNNNGGGFSYFRYEIDTEQLEEGITFADGTVQKTAYTVTNVLSSAPNKRFITEESGFERISLTELVFGNSLETTVYVEATDTNTITISETPEILELYETTSFFDVQFSFDGNQWIDARITGFSSLPVRRYFISDFDGAVTVTTGQTIFIRTRAGAEPVRWFRASVDNFRGAVIDFHAYSQNSGTIVGTIHIIRDSGEYNITHTEVKSGNEESIENLDIWVRRNNEREIWARRSDGQSDTLAFHWHGKFFAGTEYWD
jgi:hypothetical protein